MAPPKKTNPLLIGCFVLLGLGVLLVGCVAVISSMANKSATTASPPVVDTGTTAPQAKANGKTVAAKPAPAAAQVKPVTVLTEHGNGIKSTQSFTVHADWDLAYAYDCSSFGSQGNFVVTVNGSAGDVLVNELGAKGKDTTHQHNGPGRIALDVNSECAWSIRVDQLP